MQNLALAGSLGTIFDLMLVVLGFSFIVFVHELGHFLAARWAGIRVLAFAIGFGGALVSYRKGLGLRLGSSEREYRRRLADRGGRVDGPIPEGMGGLSPTEYRINWLPLGGYVKMLGQEDDDPSARSDAPDAYQRCKPWKRMIVISAGVVMNVILAAVLFVIVFSAGLKTEAAVVGAVGIGTPADKAGVQQGDRIVAVNGRTPDSFKDVAISVAMAAGGEPLALTVRRPASDGLGEGELVELSIVPQPDPESRLLALGIGPGATPELSRPKTPAEAELLARAYERAELKGVEPGSVLLAADGVTPVGPWWLDRAARASGGRPFSAIFRSPEGVLTTVRLAPTAELQVAQVAPAPDRIVLLEHVVGMVPVMTVRDVEAGGRAAGLKPGDVMARIGSVEYPSLLEGVAEIRARAGQTVAMAVEREGQLVDLGAVKVSGDGRVGFAIDSTARTSACVSRWPASAGDSPAGAAPPGFAALGVPPGSTILSIGGRPVGSLGEAREALRATLDGPQGGTGPVAVEYRPAVAGAEPRTVQWTLSPADREALSRLSWLSPVSPGLFEPETKLLRGDSLAGALALGVRETHRVMVQTYLTFARLFQGSVKIEHLKGPVGIAHVGTLIADKGTVWLLFFMAVISVNLAVINFLPLPIVDGGHLLFLVWEHFTGRPVSVVVQNVATLAGLAMIGTIFLIVTYNDIARLITGG